MAPFSQPPAQSTPGSGTTREVDLRVDLQNQVSPNTLRARSGIVLTGIINVADGVWDFIAGRLAIRIPTGLGYGWLFGYGVTVNLSRVAAAGALPLRNGVTRLITGMLKSGATGNVPNGDIGVDFVIGIPGGIPDLWTANNTHAAGTSGWCLILNSAVQWCFRVKQPDTGQGIWSEDLPLAQEFQDLLNSGAAPTIVESRCYDATVGSEAKMELYLNTKKVLTRYWTNPSGVSTPTLPPIGKNAAGISGYLLTMALRNMSVGPTAMYFFDPSIIQGPADSGTL